MLTKELVNKFVENAEVGTVLFFETIKKYDPFGEVMQKKELIICADGYIVQMHGIDPECLEGKTEPFSFEKFSEIDIAIEAYNSIDMNINSPYYYR